MISQNTIKERKRMEGAIRKYHKHDKESCLSAFKSNTPLYFTEEEVRDFENFLNRLDNTYNDADQGETYFYVIAFNDRVIGCGGFSKQYNQNTISLAWGFIHKDFHKKGLGEQLLTYRLKQIDKLYPSASVVIDTTQFSYSFFEKFGFCTTKITKDYYTVGMHRYDMTLKRPETLKKAQKPYTGLREAGG